MAVACDLVSFYSHLISVPAPSFLHSASVLLLFCLHCQYLGMGNCSSLSELQALSLLQVLRCLLHQSAGMVANLETGKAVPHRDTLGLRAFRTLMALGLKKPLEMISKEHLEQETIYLH